MVIPEVRQERLYQKIANLIIKLINDNIFPPGGFYRQNVNWQNSLALAAPPYGKPLLYWRSPDGSLSNLVMALSFLIKNMLPATILSKKFFLLASWLIVIARV